MYATLTLAQIEPLSAAYHRAFVTIAGTEDSDFAFSDLSEADQATARRYYDVLVELRQAERVCTGGEESYDPF